MAVLVHGAKSEAFDERAATARDQRRKEKCGDEARPFADLITQKRAEHVEAACAKLRTPIMLKMSVSPLAIRNNNMP